MADSDDPFFQTDLNQRPRPGGGRRGVPDQTFVRTASSSMAEQEPLPPPARGLLGVGLNPLVQAASPILLLAGQLRVAKTSSDVGGLRRQAMEEIRRFQDQARAGGVQNEIVLAARYALCACLDEAVLSTPWGSQSEWSQHPLLVELHREAWGGEKFFEMLDRISVDPSRHVDLMELQYLAIAFGFTGKYEMMPRGHEQLATLQRNLFRTIRTERGNPGDQELSLRWRGLEDRRNRLVRYVPWWVVVAAGIAVVGLAFAIYYSRLGSQAAPLQARLAQVGMEDFSTPPPVPRAPVAGPTLKQLLAPEETAGALTVEEEGTRTRVTLRGADMFNSGSATLNPSYEATLQKVAAALTQVPGRVQVVGHTDNQRIRSLRFRDNFDLSRERAVTVADVLKRTIDNPARLTWNGVGSSEPLAENTTAENRARNRRVEILHLRGM